MANGKGLLPNAGRPTLMNQIRPGRPELPSDWASLTDEEIRERLRLMRYSEKMIEGELRRYNEYRASTTKAPPDEPKTEPKPKSGFLTEIERTVKGGK